MNNSTYMTFYLAPKIRKKKLISKLMDEFIFDNLFNSNGSTYLENNKYLIVISKHFIRVTVFNKDSPDSIKIHSTLNHINMRDL